jgi:hypothetical protein
MYEKIVPRLHEIQFFEANSFHDATKPSYDGDRWWIRGEFFVKDELTDNLGHIFPFLMCNNAFFEKYKKRLEKDDWRPIIIEEFDIDSATKLIADKIKEAGDYISLSSLWKHLSTFSDTEYDL